VARIEGYRFGRVVVDGREQRADLIVLPDRTVTGWWRRRGHELVSEDLAEVVAELPERLIIGTGAEGRMRPDRAALDDLAARGVTVEVLPTPEAVRRYCESDPARTAAALHLTC
jgi:hypothetical protein